MYTVVKTTGTEDTAEDTYKTSVLVGVKCSIPTLHKPKADRGSNAFRRPTTTEVGHDKLGATWIIKGKGMGRNMGKSRLAYFTVMHSKIVTFTNVKHPTTK